MPQRRLDTVAIEDNQYSSIIAKPVTVQAPMDTPLYRQLAAHFERSITNATLRSGDRLPSIRALRTQFRVSVSTVVQALVWLENRGYVEARNRSRFLVRPIGAELLPAPPAARTPLRARSAGVDPVLGEVLRAAADPRHVPLGAGSPPAALLPMARLNHWVRRVTRETPAHSGTYTLPPGSADLRRQLARRAAEIGMDVAADEIVITSGAMEALNLAVRAVVKPGDVVAVETPTYFGILQILESLGVRIVELPTHASTGVDLDRLEHAILKHRVRACVVMTNCHNPLGFVLPDDAKRALVELAHRRKIAIVEDDIYGDLAFSPQRPLPAKAFDRDGRVLLCSSFSKVLAPGFRVGWILPGRFQPLVEQLQFINTVAAASLPQLAIARFLESGGYQRHLRHLRDRFACQVRAVSSAVAKYFPAGTCVTRPDGGYLLWVQLPDGIAGSEVYKRALSANISVVPGQVFSASSRFGRHLRISCAVPWSADIDRALLVLGRLAHDVAHLKPSG